MSHRDDFTAASIYQAETACIYAGVSGSVGSTAREERVDYSTGSRVEGEKTFTTVERVASSTTSPASLWRVTASSDPTIVGVVLVQSALPGRATSHAAEEVSA